MSDREMDDTAAHGREMTEAASDGELVLFANLMTAAEAVLNAFLRHSQEENPALFADSNAAVAQGRAMFALVIQCAPNQYTAALVKDLDGRVNELGRLNARPGGGAGWRMN